ncbi:MAG TPA: zinc-binding dehydrogenase [Actinomycetota bacterium]|nr:zinc-binding dehydrogenase [Actinomycetota bacterium]
MRGVVAVPDRPELVQIRDVAEPEPSDDESVVEVRACSLNRGELRLIASRPGWRPGQDVAGVVVRAAGDGTGPPVGTRVAAVVDGAGWAERAAAPVARSCVLPDAVTFEAGASIGVAGLTALRALRLGGSLLGARVLVTGASGGVGRFAVQLASAGGAHVTAVVGSTARGAGLEDLGARRVVLDDVEHEDTFDLVLDMVAGSVLERAIRALGPGALAVMIGMASAEPARIGLFDFERGADAQVRPFRLYTTEVDTFGADLRYLASSIADGRISAPVGLDVPWTELPRALEALRARTVAGKVVFRPSKA